MKSKRLCILYIIARISTLKWLGCGVPLAGIPGGFPRGVMATKTASAQLMKYQQQYGKVSKWRRQSSIAVKKGILGGEAGVAARGGRQENVVEGVRVEPAGNQHQRLSDVMKPGVS